MFLNYIKTLASVYLTKAGTPKKKIKTLMHYAFKFRFLSIIVTDDSETSSIKMSPPIWY